jgi:thiamine pyridinylase
MPEKRNALFAAFLCCVLAAGAALVFFGIPGSVTPAAQSSLHVALYPGIVDVNGDGHERTIAILTDRFEQQYPDVNLTLEISEKYDTYDLENIPQVFAPDGPDLVVVDLTILARLVAGGYVRPYDPESPEAAALLEENLDGIVEPFREMGVVGGTVYAIPTWLCSEFRFSRTPPSDAPASGYFSGSWTLPELYLSGYASNYGSDPKLLARALADAAENDLDEYTVQGLEACFAEGTDVDGRNKCLNGYYNDSYPGARDFAGHRTDRYTGFSETFRIVLLTNPAVADEDIEIRGAVFGDGTHPSLAWADGFVLNAHADPAATADALRFVAFYNSPETKEILAFSLDAENASVQVPRYLMPASSEFYTLARTADDPYYPEFYRIISGMSPYPVMGIPATADAIFCNLARALSADGMDIDAGACAVAG